MRVDNYNHVHYAAAAVKWLGFTLNVYVYVDDGVLVDTGPGRLANEFAAFFAAQEISKVVLTHHHEDHSGNAHLLDQKGVPVYVHRTSLPLCRNRAGLPLYRRFFWGTRPGFEALPVPAAVQGREKELEVLELPGHSFDHIALYNPREGYVFTGDLFVSTKTRLMMSGESVPETINSLQCLLEKDFKTVFCGHAGVVENGREKLHRKLEYLVNLQGEIKHLHQQGFSVGAINKKLFSLSPLALVSANEWSSKNIIRSVIRES